MSAQARGWLAWCKLFSCCVDPSSRQGFFIVSRFDFCPQILSADFYHQQICLLSADSVSSFSFCQQILSADFLSKQSPFCQPILSTDFSYQTFLKHNWFLGSKHYRLMTHIFVANTLLYVFVFFRSFPWPEDFLFLSRFCQKMFLVSRFCFQQQIFAVSRFCFRKQISSEDFLRQQICFSSANVFTLVNKTTLAPVHPFSRQPVLWWKHFLLRRARIFAAITIALVLLDLPVLCILHITSTRRTSTWKVRPSTFQPLRLRPLSGARQPCSDWLDARHLAIVLIHPSRQGFSSWAVFLCCEQILWANFCCEQIFWANSCSEQIWFLWAVFLYCEQIFFALSNLCVDRNRVMRTYLDCTKTEGQFIILREQN